MRKVSAQEMGCAYFDTIIYYGTIRAVLSDMHLIVMTCISNNEGHFIL